MKVFKILRFGYIECGFQRYDVEKNECFRENGISTPIFFLAKIWL